ncbi:carboxypeptidase regulatory-like domain-containing protein [Acidobacteria bacterium AH-259-G07]|nr:carboxypeptidase regulatory-like domain-containing protein [Acidobacteria bacterium AH-259-G07]
MFFEIRRSSLLLCSLCLVLISPQVLASSLGHFTGILQDQTGQPVANILVALLQKSSAQSLPILTRSNAGGEIQLNNIETGNYEILVKSSKYLSPQKNVIQVRPGKTTVVTLILQQLFQLDSSGGENLSVKTLLRTSEERRLIFRDFPEATSETSKTRPLAPFFEEAAFEVYSNAGLDGDYFVFPGNAAGGTTTNFAFVESAWGNNKYIMAGQLNSGEDSLWRLKNIIEYPLNDSHSMRVFVGYGRMSFDQPSLALLSNPTALGDNLGDNLDYTRALGTTQILSLGFQERLLLGSALSLLWGLELDQVRTNVRRTFLNPNAELSFSPTGHTKVQLLMASKRITHRSSLVLPDGDVVNLSDAVYFSRVGDQFSIGTSRHYQASITQQLNQDTGIEFAAYENQLFGGATPFLAVFKYQPEVQALHLDDEQANNSGYRLTLRRRLGPNLHTSVSYIRGNGAGVNWQGPALVFEESSTRALVERKNYHAVSTEIEAYIPSSRTHLNALVKFVPNGNPITTLDPFSDTYETGNEGINLFVRQMIPVPAGWLSFVGLDFLSVYQYKIEALFDIRNLTNEDLGKMQTAMGDVTLVRSPRTVRGGVALRF